jgi:hypothetical protein
MANNILVIAAAFAIGFLIGLMAVRVLTAQAAIDKFASKYQEVPPYDLSVPLPAVKYNSLYKYTNDMSCSDCFYHGMQSAQSDMLYSQQEQTTTPAQRVLPDTLLAWNGHHKNNSPARLLPIQIKFIEAAARIYGASLRGAAHCGTNCSITAEDTLLWHNTPPVALAQLWSAVAVLRGNATPTQTLVYNAALAPTPTEDQQRLLAMSCRDIAIADAKTASSPSRAQIALLAAAAAVKSGSATAAQNSYYTHASPYTVARFDTALQNAKVEKATAAESALLATMPPA